MRSATKELYYIFQTLTVRYRAQVLVNYKNINIIEKYVNIIRLNTHAFCVWDKVSNVFDTS